MSARSPTAIYYPTEATALTAFAITILHGLSVQARDGAST